MSSELNGFIYQDPNGQCHLKTLTDNEIGMMVNALGLFLDVYVTRAWGDNDIRAAFEQRKGDKARVIPCVVTVLEDEPDDEPH